MVFEISARIFLNFGKNVDFDVTEELLPCLNSSRNSALNELEENIWKKNYSNARTEKTDILRDINLQIFFDIKK